MNLRVETYSGSIQGFEENGLYKYLGIPYAQKPLDDLASGAACRRSPGRAC